MTALSDVQNGLVAGALVAVLGERRGAHAADSADMLGEGHLDSFTVMELAAHLETRLDIVIPPDALTVENFASLASLNEMCSSLAGP